MIDVLFYPVLYLFALGRWKTHPPDLLSSQCAVDYESEIRSYLRHYRTWMRYFAISGESRDLEVTRLRIPVSFRNSDSNASPLSVRLPLWQEVRYASDK